MAEPDLTGRVCVVTGASRGIGTVTARRLAQMGATVALVGRDPEASQRALALVRAASSPERVTLHLADFADLGAVRGLAAELLAGHRRIDVLVNNAGLWLNSRQLTADGVEKTFAVNHLAPFLLTNLLLDRMRESAPARVVTVASRAHFAGRLDFDDLYLQRRYSGWGAYARTKLANVLFTRELAQRLDSDEVTANSCHPGNVRTELGRDWGVSRILYTMGKPFMISPERGARTQVWLASDPALEGVTGGYFSGGRPARTSLAAQDPVAAARLWEISAELTGLE